MQNNATTIHRLGLTLALLAAFGCIHFAFPHLIGIDGYFHIRYSQMLRTQGFFDSLPWLSATIYAQNFVDDHFLFHVLQMPFTFGDNLILSAKLYSLVVATAIFLLFHHILTTHRIPYAILWTSVLFVSSPIFLLRISMPRAPGISLFILLLATHLILLRKYRWVGLVAFLYVWTYGGFPLLGGLVGCAFLTTWMYTKKAPWQLLLSTGLGTILGLVIHPYFPDNLHFLYLSYTKIELGMFPDVIPAGTEDYPYAASTAVKHTLLVWMILFATFLFFLVRPNTITQTDMLLLLFSTILLCLYLEVRRFIEYWPPFCLLFSAFALRPLQQHLQDFPKKITALVLSAVLLLAATNTVYQIQRIRDNEHNPDLYANAAVFLRENTPANSIVFTSDWDDFPILFFHNPHNYYIVGLGLHYLYFYDADLFTRWLDITDGLVSNPAEAIRESFGADYAICHKAESAFLLKLENDPNANLLYEDDYASVFKLAGEISP